MRNLIILSVKERLMAKQKTAHRRKPCAKWDTLDLMTALSLEGIYMYQDIKSSKTCSSLRDLLKLAKVKKLTADDDSVEKFLRKNKYGLSHLNNFTDFRLAYVERQRNCKPENKNVICLQGTLPKKQINTLKELGIELLKDITNSGKTAEEFQQAGINVNFLNEALVEDYGLAEIA